MIWNNRLVLEDYAAHMRLRNRETQGAHIQSVIGPSQIIGYLIVVSNPFPPAPHSLPPYPPYRLVQYTGPELRFSS